MYAIPTDLHMNLRTNRGLSEYARLEYGKDSVGWLIAEMDRERRVRVRHGLRRRLFARNVPPVRRALPHKGVPRGRPFDGPWVV